MAAPGIPFDLGCEWLHSADKNDFVGIAKELGFAVDKSRPPWRDQAYDAAFSKAKRDEFFAAIDAFYERAEEAAENEIDAPAATCLEPGNPWNPMIDAVSTYINGFELKDVSLHDMDAYEDTDINWRLPDGYGALIAAYGAPCPVALNTEVTVIDHSGARIRIETSRGTLSAAKVIVCVPTNLIANENIRFTPPLPSKVEAAAGLPLGADNKVMLALADAEKWPSDIGLRGAAMRTGVGSFHLRPSGRPCIAGFFGGSFARDLEDAGEGALAAQSIDEIVALLGSDIRSKLTPLARNPAGVTIASRKVPIRRRSPAMPMPARFSRRRWMAGCSLPAKRHRRISSRRRMGRGRVESGRRRKCWPQATRAKRRRSLTPSPLPSSPHPARYTPRSFRRCDSGSLRSGCRPDCAAPSAPRTARAPIASRAASTTPSAPHRI